MSKLVVFTGVSSSPSNSTASLSSPVHARNVGLTPTRLPTLLSLLPGAVSPQTFQAILSAASVREKSGHPLFLESIDLSFEQDTVEDPSRNLQSFSVPSSPIAAAAAASDSVLDIELPRQKRFSKIQIGIEDSLKQSGMVKVRASRFARNKCALPIPSLSPSVAAYCLGVDCRCPVCGYGQRCGETLRMTVKADIANMITS